jgi:uncharacterized membrane protein
MSEAVNEDAERAILGALTIGRSRTIAHDPAYGLRELADVALRALSPGVNDPTTAQDAIFHATAVLAELLVRPPPPRVYGGCEGRVVVVQGQPDHADLIRLAFDEVRRAATAHPTVCVYLLESLAALIDRVGTRAPELGAHLQLEADLVLSGLDATDVLDADRDPVHRAHARLFRHD